ncbi:MAG: RHS repeat-associated core domain-containing protein [Bacteroidales bacterium]|nr:RHS repeat-associated core domain-containing protein [Bacteroidales bacterium]
MNSQGQVTEYELGNDLTTIWEYDNYNYPQHVYVENTSGVRRMDMSFNFDAYEKVFDNRQDHIHSRLSESYEYDNANRLTDFGIPGERISIQYDDDNGTGNILSKTDVGSYDYTGTTGGPHAINYLTGSNIPVHSETIEYTAFDKVARIENTDENTELAFTYGPDRARKKTVFNAIGYGPLKTKIYAGGLYEKEIQNINGDVCELFYIPGPDGVAAIHVRENGSDDDTYYIHKDYLGSYRVITNGTGNIATVNGTQQIFDYDPWGRRRNPFTWTYAALPEDRLFDRGFTGHEHLDAFGLINMNGRVYDPILGRMLSPDNYIGYPGYAGNYDRYAYALNNPINFIDPDGNNPALLVAGIFALWNAINSGVMSAQSPGGWDWNAFARGATVGFVSSAVGSAFGYVTSTAMTSVNGCLAGFVFGGLSGAVTGGVVGGLTNAAMGGDFAQGLKEGAITGGISGAIMGLSVGYDNAHARGLNKLIGKSTAKSRAEYRNYNNIGEVMRCSLGGMPPPGGDVASSGGAFTGYKGNRYYFEGVRVRELNFGNFKYGAAMTVPGVGIFVGPGGINDVDLLKHEFGHILQARKWGAGVFYGDVAPASLRYAKYANSDPYYSNLDYMSNWTEWSANYLSYKYFKGNFNTTAYPISPVNSGAHIFHFPHFVNTPSEFYFDWLGD